MNSRPVRWPSAKLQHPMVVYSAFSISRRGSARSIKGLIPSSLVMASELGQQRDCLGTVALSIPLSQGVSVVATSPGQLRPVACVAAEG